MRLGFDLHGTINNDYLLLQFFKGLICMGNFQVFIISGPPKNQIRSELRELGFSAETLNYFEIISVVDFLKSKNVDWRIDENGNYWFDENLWWESKGLICFEYSIDIIFDDLIEYAKHMPDTTRFILWKGEKNEGINEQTF